MRHRPRRSQLLPVVAALALAACSAVPPAAEQLAAAPPGAGAASAPAATPPAADPPRYTFSWPLDSTALKPRGGSTRGAPLVIDRTPTAAWQALQAPSLGAQERDRRAILAMAGPWRVTFDFIDIANYGPNTAPRAPYQSWGTEKVFVARNEPGFVSLVHILEMRFVGDDGSTSAPMVTKHWRQDWTWQPRTIVEYKGLDRWQRRTLKAADVKGTWLQTVYQVDESPRYAALGRWQHNAGFSTWVSGDTWRPLPRREWSVRDDYHVLIGTNRHTIAPAGWLQEENNLKAVLTDMRALNATLPYVAREYGTARYERMQDPDFANADRYYERTRGFWGQVQTAWDDAFARQGDGIVTLRGPVDKLGLFMPLFERAEQIDEQTLAGAEAERENARVIDAALAAMGATSAVKPPGR